MTLKEYVDTLKLKRVAVIGIGISNTPLIDLLLENGVSVTLCDRRDAEAIGAPAELFAAKGAEMRL
jgi:UDP-N-acetylmuramoylalanine--D-glutamate ligase